MFQTDIFITSIYFPTIKHQKSCSELRYMCTVRELILKLHTSVYRPETTLDLRAIQKLCEKRTHGVKFK